MKYRMARGTADVLPEEAVEWEYVERTSKDVFKLFNYKEIRTPIFEHTELFQRGVGETTDIVEKEMYTFKDKSDRSLTLRPEGTASVVRSFVEHKLYASPDPVKLFYIGPMFRYERPKSGRSRQFTQIGVEAFGSKDPSVDAEVISLAMTQFEKMNMHDFRLELNSVGCPDCRLDYRKELMTHLHGVKDELCEDCQSRFDRNPMRILDCKNETCNNLTKEAPVMVEHLCDDCQTHYDQVKNHLDNMGIEYVENPRLVRGLDYYTQTAFEIMSVAKGVEGTLCGGGRYNGLVAEIGGDDVPGIGYAFSLERILALKAKNVELALDAGIDLYLILLGDKAKARGTKLLNELRKVNIAADMDYLNRKLKAQMKTADRIKAKFTVIIGEDELENNKAILRNMQTGAQEELSLDLLVTQLADRVNGAKEEKE